MNRIDWMKAPKQQCSTMLLSDPVDPVNPVQSSFLSHFLRSFAFICGNSLFAFSVPTPCLRVSVVKLQITEEATELANIYYDADADLGVLARRTVAVIGYGSQGHAHA